MQREQESLQFWSAFGELRREQYRRTGVLPDPLPGVGLADLPEDVIEEEDESSVEAEKSDEEHEKSEERKEEDEDDEDAWESSEGSSES